MVCSVPCLFHPCLQRIELQPPGAVSRGETDLVCGMCIPIRYCTLLCLPVRVLLYATPALGKYWAVLWYTPKSYVQ